MGCRHGGGLRCSPGVPLAFGPVLACGPVYSEGNAGKNWRAAGAGEHPAMPAFPPRRSLRRCAAGPDSAGERIAVARKL
ncbi:hypothetical protein CBM2623_B110061 [Cupriavidus taiwanensis]|nr:hypothetical protein CBM2623_B110061 [Cupriavidus taiwanensis]